MWNDPKETVKHIDKTTVDGLAEALMIAALHVKKDGKYVALRFGNTPEDSIDFARQMAEILLGGTDGNH